MSFDLLLLSHMICMILQCHYQKPSDNLLSSNALFLDFRKLAWEEFHKTFYLCCLDGIVGKGLQFFNLLCYIHVNTNTLLTLFALILICFFKKRLECLTYQNI